MPRPRRQPNGLKAAEALVRTAPLVSRWIERLLASHEPPLTVAQYLALEAIAEGEVVGAELARRAAVTPAAVSQLLAALEDEGLLTRARLEDDRRRQPLALTGGGERALRSARTALRERLAGLLVDLPPPEADALARLLERLQGSLSGTPPPPRPHRPPPPPRGPKKHRRP
jgi:DNA-binding MarR family transcriptional regulator